jgi:hypothetical protein
VKETATIDDFEDLLIDCYGEICTKECIVVNMKEAAHAIRICTDSTFRMLNEMPDEKIIACVRLLVKTIPYKMTPLTRRRDK